MSFHGKAVLVTGATSGIGRAAALAFAAQGAQLIVTARSPADLEAVADQASGGGARVVTIAADLILPAAADRIVSAAVEAFGGLDVLVNAAGIIANGTVENTTDDAWDQMMAVNLAAPFRLMRAAAPHLAARKGAVVNVSSVNGLRAFSGLLAYNVSKAALDHLTRCAALELAPVGVRVNAINPGVTVTNLHRRAGMDDARYAAFLDRAKETHPLGRPGRPEEIAELILFLASERSSWMTGETIPIDGGRHLTCLR
jgi:NAD(P)-dependent dehydrogenase (short-subunit alcohol dehydrogenase family)